MATGSATVDDYIAGFPADIQVILEDVRRHVRSAAPAGVDVISYQIPTLRLSGKNVVSYAAWKDHIALYPAPTVEGDLALAVAPYLSGKSTVKFPLAEPIPMNLIERLVAALVKQQADSGA